MTSEYSSGFRGPIGFKPLPVSGLMGLFKIEQLKKVEMAVNRNFDFVKKSLLNNPKPV